MAFRVEISPQALQDLDVIADYIRKRGSLESAERWFRAMIDVIRSLNDSPSRCPRAKESNDIGVDLRLLLHGKGNRRYKIYFAIQEMSHCVHVLHIRHWARKPVSGNEFEELTNTQRHREE